MPDLPAVTFGMIDFPASFRQDRIAVHPRPDDEDGEGSPETTPGTGSPVEIDCQVADSKTTEIARATDDIPAPFGTLVKDIMFDQAGYDALVAGGIIAPDIGSGLRKDIVAFQRIDWIKSRKLGTFETPRVLIASGPISIAHGIGARYTITAKMNS